MTINRFLDPKSKRDSRKRLFRETSCIACWLCIYQLIMLVHLWTMSPGFRPCPFVCSLCLWVPTFVIWDRSATLWLQCLKGMSFCFCAVLHATCYLLPKSLVPTTCLPGCPSISYCQIRRHRPARLPGHLPVAYGWSSWRLTSCHPGLDLCPSPADTIL